MKYRLRLSHSAPVLCGYQLCDRGLDHEFPTHAKAKVHMQALWKEIKTKGFLGVSLHVLIDGTEHEIAREPK